MNIQVGVDGTHMVDVSDVAEVQVADGRLELWQTTEGDSDSISLIAVFVVWLYYIVVSGDE